MGVGQGGRLAYDLRVIYYQVSCAARSRRIARIWNWTGMSEPLIITLGCRLNAYETEVMRRHTSEAGLDNCVIVNTCAVTGEAVRQAAQAIRKLRRERPDATLVVTGCAAQIEPERFAEMPEVDHVIGNAEKMARSTYDSALDRDLRTRGRPRHHEPHARPPIT